jgi:hypothetical protein
VKGGHDEKLSNIERYRRREQGDAASPDPSQMSPDFRRQLAARAMEHKIPVQVIPQSTLRLGPPVAGNTRNGAQRCLLHRIGFRRSDDADPRTACCAAQMFLDTGDGNERTDSKNGLKRSFVETVKRKIEIEPIGSLR